VRRVETTTPLPDHGRFTEALGAVQAYVRSEPGAHTALMDAARRDPEGMTVSLVALGAVLLDIAAGAFRLTPDEMLDKVAAQIADRSDLSIS
jgi:hypothetical protein